jgi:hypothetical protein
MKAERNAPLRALSSLQTANLAAVEPQEFATSSALGPSAVLFTTCQQPELPHLVKITEFQHAA